MKRLSAIYSEAFVAGVAKELADARAAIYAKEGGLDEALAAIHKRFTYRMQDLGEFMKGLFPVAPGESPERQFQRVDRMIDFLQTCRQR
ncbi:MAG TPA: hypothetical protein VF258_04520 [Luteolibacter sp.]